MADLSADNEKKFTCGMQGNNQSSRSIKSDAYNEKSPINKRLVEYFFVLTPQLREDPGSLPLPTVDTDQRDSIIELTDLINAIDDQVEDKGSGAADNINLNQSFLSQDNETFEETVERINQLGFDHVISSRFPMEDNPDNPLTDMITSFCYPKEAIKLLKDFSLPKVHYFVSTGDKGQKIYGCCLTICEPVDIYLSGLSDDFEEGIITSLSSLRKDYRSSLYSESLRSSYNMIAEESLNEIEVTIDKPPTLYLPKCVCVLSKWPYFTAFREYLSQLYRLSTMPMEIPIERYVMTLCKEVPVPPPGSFEVQLQLLNSNIKFWSPPANQPIAWASLPFAHLFSCLSIENIIVIWHAITLERQVLLVSSQLSLLGTCAEIFISLLFPLEWPHMYIPVLPHFLTPVLDAPMPYLCGIDAANYESARNNCLSAECIVVELDKNRIIVGPKTPSLPALPSKRKQKLEKSLELNAGQVFHAARCLSKTDVIDDTLRNQANQIWKNRLCQYDGAFSLAYTPDSNSDALNEELSMDSTFSSLQSARDAVQEAFMRFFVSLLKHYRNYLIYPSNDESHDENVGPGFRTKSFIAKQYLYEDARSYLKEFCATQLFDTFVTKRLYDPGAADVIFFDQSIDAKLNRSMLKVKKVETPFLQSATLWRKSKSINLKPVYDESSPSGPFIYSCFPSSLYPTLFGKPRAFPEEVYDEFSKYAGQDFRLRSKVPNGVKEVYQSAEVATFTIFFMMFTRIIGEEVQELIKGLSTAETFADESYIDFSEKEDAFINTGVEFESQRTPSKESISFIDRPNYDKKCNSESSLKVPTTPVQSLRRLVYHSSPSIARRKRRPLSVASYLDEARSVADAQLSLVFETLFMMRKRKLLPDTSSYKHLITACGKCGDTTRATQLIGLMHEDGIVADSIVYSCLLNAFSVDNTVVKSNQISNGNILPHWANGVQSNLHLNWNRLSKKTSFSSLPTVKLISSGSAGVFTNSDRNAGNDVQTMKPGLVDMANSIINKISSPKKISNYSVPMRNFLVTEGVSRQLVIGEMCLNDLYPGLHINIHGERCPECDSPLSVENIQAGWLPGYGSDETTLCPKCTKRFTPRFSVKCSAPRFVSANGVNSPLLLCTFLSPWVVKRKVSNIMMKMSLDEILKPSWRNEGGENAVIWWNLVVAFILNRLPITFLLQGSVKTRLIIPMPNEPDSL